MRPLFKTQNRKITSENVGKTCQMSLSEASMDRGRGISGYSWIGRSSQFRKVRLCLKNKTTKSKQGPDVSVGPGACSLSHNPPEDRKGEQTPPMSDVYVCTPCVHAHSSVVRSSRNMLQALVPTLAPRNSTETNEQTKEQKRKPSKCSAC